MKLTPPPSWTGNIGKREHMRRHPNQGAQHMKYRDVVYDIVFQSEIVMEDTKGHATVRIPPGTEIDILIGPEGLVMVERVRFE